MQTNKNQTNTQNNQITKHQRNNLISKTNNQLQKLNPTNQTLAQQIKPTSNKQTNK